MESILPSQRNDNALHCVDTAGELEGAAERLFECYKRCFSASAGTEFVLISGPSGGTFMFDMHLIVCNMIIVRP
jgi:hypothetical protein